ncbi:triphosphoribosyl-dephospho-CoA synthase CitG [Streptococcus sp. S784/96/1]|uniref:triphosphoribosyl-dephospho-CoA synthase CitG n=1 Tax=Streptococcus sp. S784/96/1 TaxID=2653499 RepID=UPI0013876028|nr:triphosphoribosyl-dephospho-CoA synthase CitG [Streptococcus sp. S784/96/1]
MPDTPFQYFSNLATKALLYEVSLSPKPGLVDRFDDGAHIDMTFSTFIDSTMALAPFFEKYISLGYQMAEEPPLALFNALRDLGIKAEQAMFEATGGINTHKGVNFSLAVLLGATGAYLKKHLELLKNPKRFSEDDTKVICQITSSLCCHLIETDLSHLSEKKELTYGEKLYLDYGIKGPRGEASEGFPTLTKALPFFREKLKQNDKELAQLQLLLYLMTFVEDGNIIHRGGIEAWQQVKEECQKMYGAYLTKSELVHQLSIYNDILISRNLSPGGTADLLALTFYFAMLEGIL